MKKSSLFFSILFASVFTLSSCTGITDANQPPTEEELIIDAEDLKKSNEGPKMIRIRPE